MGIEEVAQKCPECLFKVPISVKNGPTNEQLVKLAQPLLKTAYGQYLIDVANGL